MRGIQAALRTLRDAGRTTTICNDILAHLSHVFDQAIKDRTLSWNPCITVDRLQRTEPKAEDTKYRALTENETKLFLQRCKAAIAITFASGSCKQA